MNDNLKKRLASVENNAVDIDQKRPTAPDGWKAGVVWDGIRGEITTDSVDSASPHDWDELLEARGLDPTKYEIDGDTIRWTSYDGWKRDHPDDPAYSTICYSFKAQIRLKAGHAATPDLEALYKETRKKKTRKPTKTEGDDTLIIALSDWQIGNGDFEGIQGQVDAIDRLINQLPEHIKAHRKAGNPCAHIVVAGLGDIIENCTGYYPSQEFTVQADRRDQTKIARRAIRDLIAEIAPLSDNITVTAVGGNHGENRKGKGGYYTTINDNDDVSVFEQVAEILHQNSNYSHVHFGLPTDTLTSTVETSGRLTTFTHGHQAKYRTTALNTMWHWWTDQTMGQYDQGPAQSDLLICGHYHHLNIKQQKHRTIIITPSLTTVNQYFANTNGVTTQPGTCTIHLTPNGINNINLLH